MDIISFVYIAIQLVVIILNNILIIMINKSTNVKKKTNKKCTILKEAVVTAYTEGLKHNAQIF